MLPCGGIWGWRSPIFGREDLRRGSSRFRGRLGPGRLWEVGREHVEAEDE